jgi:Zn-dependent protease
MALEPYIAARQREDLRVIAEEVIDVHSVRHEQPEERGVIRLDGTLQTDPQAAYDVLAPRFRALGYTPLLQEGDTSGDGGVSLLAMPGLILKQPSRLWLAVVLFLITVASTIFAQGVEVGPKSIGFNWVDGIAFSVALLSILLAHELGHYLMARRLNVGVSYPFFIPMPLTPIGTLGAFISMKEPPPDRRALLSIAIAGPLAGLVIAIPVLFLGLMLSEVQTLTTIEAEVRELSKTPPVVMIEGNSLLYGAAKYLVFGQWLPNDTADVWIHPVAWAGWVGLLVTGLNLIPAGQLDGGHIFYALAGARAARTMTWILAAVLLAMGVLAWSGWILWAVLILLLGRRHAPLLNEMVPLDNRLRMVAVFGIVVFILVFTPVPITIIELNNGW